MTTPPPRIARLVTTLGLGLALSMGMAATAAAAPFELPPLVQPPSTERHPGKMVWADLITSDLAGSKYFYGRLFGWTFRDIHSGDREYSVAMRDGAPVAGIVKRTTWRGERRQPAWITFISGTDVDQAQRTIVAEGGHVVWPPHDIAQRGRQAVFADPQGAVFGVLQSSSGDPEDTLADPGEWIWSSIITNDPDAEAAFYKSVFGYQAFEMSGEDGSRHIVLSSDNYARASSDAMPPKAATLQPHWLNFLRVSDATAAAEEAAALGGKVLAPPHLDEHGSTVAVIADPMGAPFGLIEWKDAGAKEATK